MKILVCGSRDYTDTEALFNTLDAMHALHPITVLIEGEAPGADTLARVWALRNNVFVQGVPAQWKTYGKAAGPIRNKEMLKHEPNLVVAFPSGRLSESKGTRNMVEQARKAKVRTVVVGIDDVTEYRAGIVIQEEPGPEALW